jgi:DNA-binding FadR family transcriptional regulator
MPPRADAATLNVQPRQRRYVYDTLAMLPAGRSLKDLLDEFEMPETELREALRKLDAAGLARRTKGSWSAVLLETDEPQSREESGTTAST